MIRLPCDPACYVQHDASRTECQCAALGCCPISRHSSCSLPHSALPLSHAHLSLLRHSCPDLQPLCTALHLATSPHHQPLLSYHACIHQPTFTK